MSSTWWILADVGTFSACSFMSTQSIYAKFRRKEALQHPLGKPDLPGRNLIGRGFKWSHSVTSFSTVPALPGSEIQLAIASERLNQREKVSSNICCRSKINCFYLIQDCLRVFTEAESQLDERRFILSFGQTSPVT